MTMIDLYAIEQLKRIVGHSPADFNHLIDFFLENSANLLSRIQTAINTGDAEALHHAAHSLKSNVAQLGAAELAEHIKYLEIMGREGRLEDASKMYELTEGAYRAIVRDLQRIKQAVE